MGNIYDLGDPGGDRIVWTPSDEAGSLSVVTIYDDHVQIEFTGGQAADGVVQAMRSGGLAKIGLTEDVGLSIKTVPAHFISIERSNIRDIGKLIGFLGTKGVDKTEELKLAVTEKFPGYSQAPGRARG